MQITKKIYKIKIIKIKQKKEWKGRNKSSIIIILCYN